MAGKIQLVENTPINAGGELQSTVASYNESVGLKHSNSVHCSISFLRGAGKGNIEATINNFIEELACRTGLNVNAITVAGVVIEAEEPVRPGMTETVTTSHAHLIVRSAKSRATGKTVARIREHHSAIADSMAGTAFESMVIEPIHDLHNLLGYIVGLKNIQAPCVKIYTISKR